MASEDVVARADSLMRRRSFVAAPPTPPAPTPREDDIPVLNDATSDNAALPDEVDDSIPLLTEEVFPDTPTSTATRDRFDETLAARLAAEFAHSLERRLAAELPTFVEASLAVLEADLRQGILDIANDAIKDFVARREQLRLPLDEPDAGDK